MPDFLGQVGNFFSSGAGKGLETLAGLGATGAGLAGNLSAEAQRSAAASAAQKNMNLTPQQLAAQVSAAQQPLNAGLVQAITGNVNANLAEQGLSEAPGLIATAQSQALAPFEQQNQQAALQLVLQKLGLPAEFLKTIPPNAQLGPLLAMLMKGQGGGATPFNPLTFQTTGPTPPSNPYQTGDTPPIDTTGTFDFGGLVPPQ
jgi:hypothetical protein